MPVFLCYCGCLLAFCMFVLFMQHCSWIRLVCISSNKNSFKLNAAFRFKKLKLNYVKQMSTYIRICNIFEKYIEGTRPNV